MRKLADVLPVSLLPAPLLLTPLLLALLLAACSDKPGGTYPGYVEADYVRLASPIAGTLTQLSLKTGDRVLHDAPAFVLEQEDERAAREEAAARVQQSQAQLNDLRKGKRPDEIKATQEQLAQANASLRLDARDLERQRQLIAAKFISPSHLDDAQAAVERDQAHVKELQADVRVTQLAARSDAIDAAQHELEGAQAQLAQANWKLTQKTQRVPVDAEVIDILYREGEWVAAGNPVVSLLPLQNIKARFFVPETVLGSLRLGEPVELACDHCGIPVVAKITYIAPQAEYTAPLIYSKENRSNLVFMIEARPNTDDALRLHPGQPLEIKLSHDDHDDHSAAKPGA
jgi:HlyD family secretion protein